MLLLFSWQGMLSHQHILLKKVQPSSSLRRSRMMCHAHNVRIQEEDALGTERSRDVQEEDTIALVAVAVLANSFATLQATEGTYRTCHRLLG